MLNKTNEIKEIFPSRERILRAIQIDNQCVEILNSKIIELIDILSNLRVIPINSEILESVSNFFYFHINYNISNNKTTAGEEYTCIKKVNLLNNSSNSGSFRKSIFYILVQSTYKNLFKKLLSDYFESLLKRVLKLLQISQNIENEYSYYNITKRILTKYFTIESFFEKLEEYQYILFFFNGYYLDFINLLFNVYYENNTKSNAAQKNLIHSSGFKILGGLILIKNIWESIHSFNNIYKSLREEIINKQKSECKLNSEIFGEGESDGNDDKGGVTKNKKIKLKQNQRLKSNSKNNKSNISSNYNEEERK